MHLTPILPMQPWVMYGHKINEKLRETTVTFSVKDSLWNVYDELNVELRV